MNLDRFVRSRRVPSGRRRGTSRRKGLASRSQVVRVALRDYLAAQETTKRNDRDREAFAKHRRVVSRQAKALVSEQAVT